jgi:hypothetical protein
VGRELPIEPEVEHTRVWAAPDASPHEHYVVKESARTLTRADRRGSDRPSPTVLVALTVDGVATENLARRLGTTPGALYKNAPRRSPEARAGVSTTRDRARRSRASTTGG